MSFSKLKVTKLEELLEQEKETRHAMLNLLEDIDEKKQHYAKVSKEWVDAFDAMDEAVMLHDVEHNIMRINRAYRDLAGEDSYEALIGKPYYHVFPKLNAPMASCEESVRTRGMAEEEITLEDGRIFRSRTYPIYDNQNNYFYGIHLFEDVTQLRKQELQILQLNTTLKLISRCNELLVHTEKEQELITNICEEIITTKGYNYAGVFFKKDENIYCQHYSLSKKDERELSKLQTINFSDQYYQKCPITICIQESRTIFIDDIEHDQQWKEIVALHSDICPSTYYKMQGSMLFFPFIANETFGALMIYSKHPNYFDQQKKELFIELSSDMSYGIQTLRLRESFQEINDERDNMLIQLRENLEETIRSVAMIVEARDPYTAGHQNRVSELAVAIARKIGLDAKKIEGIRLAGIVHDIGKIKIPAEILAKPTKLSDLEYDMIKTHPQVGYDILKNIHFPWPIATIIYQHHEHIDGTGYPNGLSGDEILLEAKILTVADVVEAMASHRPYRAALGIEAALNEIKKFRGSYYDNIIVDTCIKLFQEDNFEWTS